MSSAPPDGIRPLRGRRLGLRLLLGFSALFAASTILLFGLAYTLFLRLMTEPDRAFMRAEAQELAAAYASSGLIGLQADIASGADEDRREELIVRIADSQGRTLLLYNPDNWKPPELAQLESRPLPAGDAWYRLGPAQDEDALEAYALRLPDGRVLQVGTDAEVRRDVLISMRSAFLAIALPVLALALLGGGVMAYRALRPVHRLVDTLQEVISTGDVHRRVPVRETEGEFAALAHLFNRMLERIEALVEGMRGTLDHVAHDLRTPMAGLRGSAELALRDGLDAAALRDALADSLEASETVLTMLNTVMDVAEAEAGAMPLRKETVSLPELIGRVTTVYALVAEEKGIALVEAIPADLTVSADPGRLQQVIANLIDNGVKYTPGGGRVEVLADAEGDEVKISVRDTGMGIAPGELPRIWDRLYRGEASRTERGLGLGLSFVRAVIRAHGGSVEAESRPGEGSTFTIRLPRSRSGNLASTNLTDV